MKTHSIVLPFVFVVAAFVASVLAYPHLPTSFATHWDLSGHPNGYSSRPVGAFLIPVVMLAIWSLLFLSARFRLDLFVRYEELTDAPVPRPVYGVIFSLVLALLLAMHVFSLATALSMVGSSASIVPVIVISIFAMLLGNYMPRVTRRNAFVGFRVPWAYASDEVWRRTQRAGGYGLVLCGLVGVCAAIVDSRLGFRVLGAVFILYLVAVSLYSYALAVRRPTS